MTRRFQTLKANPADGRYHEQPRLKENAANLLCLCRKSTDLKSQLFRKNATELRNWVVCGKRARYRDILNSHLLVSSLLRTFCFTFFCNIAFSFKMRSATICGLILGEYFSIPLGTLCCQDIRKQIT